MKDVTLVGAGIVDILVQPCSYNVFKTGSYACDSIVMNVGGDALNEATILSKHDLNVELISVFGNDQTSKYIKSHCDNCGIDLSKSTFDVSYQTGINVVLVKEDGSRHFLTSKNGTLRKLELKHIPFNFHSKVFCFASIFVFPFIKDTELKILFDYAHGNNSIVCADMTKCKNNETIADLKQSLSRIDYLFPNEEEALLFTRESNIEDAALALYNAGVKNVVIKAGSKGCYVKNDTFDQFFPTSSVSCIDTTGAGDSFVSGFIYGLCKDYSFEACINLANKFGSNCVQHIGSTTWCK